MLVQLNMKAFLTATIITFCLLLVQSAQSKEANTADYQPRCNQGVYQLCGYYDRASYKKDEPIAWLIPPNFEEAFPFHEGLAVVKLNGKFGFVDRTGEFKIKPAYDAVGHFYKGLAPFQNDGWIGFIDSKGKIVAPAKFSRAVAINESTIIGSDLPAYKYESSKLLPSLNEAHVTSINSKLKSGIYNLKKGWLTDQKYYFQPFDTENHDVLWTKEKRGKSGLMRVDGRWLEKPRYDGVQPLHEGLAIVALKQDDGTYIMGAIDKGGKVVVPIKFEWLSRWNEGLANISVEQEDGTKLWGAIDKKGKVVIPIKFESLGRWMGDYALASKGDRRSGLKALVDRNGNLLGGRYFEEIRLPDHYFTATETVFLPRVKADGVWYSMTLEGKLIPDQKTADEITKGGILSCEDYTLNRTKDGIRATDKTGQTIVDFDFPKYFSFFVGPASTNSRLTCDSPLSIEHDGKYSFLLPDGTFFGGQFFERTGPLFENVAGFSVDRKWGLIDASGQVVVAPIYDNVGWYGNERFLLKAGAAVSLFDKYGTRFSRLDDPNYNQEFKTKLPPRETYLYCSGSILESKNGKWGLVSLKGEVILPFKYKALICYRKGMAWAPRDDLKKWCPLDRYGKFLPEDACQTKMYPSHTWHYYPKKLADDDYDSSVLWNLQYLDYGAGKVSAPPILSPDRVSAHKPILMGPTHGRR